MEHRDARIIKANQSKKVVRSYLKNWVWWLTPVISAARRQR
jgi:hypothetical protein